jgi:hypothetical protein
MIYPKSDQADVTVEEIQAAIAEFDESGADGNQEARTEN